jgi:toxin ParE1/3/4
MKLPHLFEPAAKEEFAAAAEWYERQRGGLGDHFVEVILALIDRICEHPMMFAVVDGDVRQAIERQFPYSILFRIQNGLVVIIAVFHSSRDPSVWQNRL